MTHTHPMQIQAKAVEAFHQAVMKPRILGSNDCFLSVARAIEPVWRADLMAGIAGNYSTWRELKSLIRDEGHACAADLLYERALAAGADLLKGEPEPFDLGLVLTRDFFHPAQDRLLGGLPVFYHEGRWLGMTHDGMLATPDRPHFAWSRPTLPSNAAQAGFEPGSNRVEDAA